MRALIISVRLLAVLCIGLANAACTADESPVGSSERLKRDVQSLLDQVVRESKLPGMTLAFVLPEGELRQFAGGYADVEQNTPMRPDTRMMSGSIGKSFVGALAAVAAAAGEIDLDDPISAWVGNASWYGDLSHADTMTLRMLLNHSAGVADHVYATQFLSTVLNNPIDHGLGTEDLVRIGSQMGPEFRPGDGYAYSDTGYIIAGLVLEASLGADYYDEIQRRFLFPLELSSTTPSTGRSHPGLAQGYFAPESPFVALGTALDDGLLTLDPGLEWTGGGLVTTSADLAVWAKLLYEGKAAGPGYLDELLASGATADDPVVGYALGVFITDSRNGTRFGHGGWFPGYMSTMVYYPSLGVSVAMQSNGGHRDELDLREIVDARLMPLIVEYIDSRTH